jgi:hypothetical protein
MVLYVEEEYGGTELVMRTMWTWPFLLNCGMTLNKYFIVK